MSYFCYILRNNNKTYNGYTVDPERRLKQHNRILKGGAKATRYNEGNWAMYALITGFKTSSNALSCEWRIKHPTNTRIRPSKYNGVIGRIKSLNEVLNLEYWTNNCDIKNSECNYNVFITADMEQYIEKDKLPKYINLEIVEKIDKKLYNK